MRTTKMEKLRMEMKDTRRQLDDAVVLGRSDNGRQVLRRANLPCQQVTLAFRIAVPHIALVCAAESGKRQAQFFLVDPFQNNEVTTQRRNSLHQIFRWWPDWATGDWRKECTRKSAD